jgi:hypothetical protein
VNDAQWAGGRGNFFIIDQRTWARVCEFGMRPACAYLVLACGTQGNNQDTNWSVNAVRNYADMGVERAKASLQTLLEKGFLRQTKGGTKPHYVLEPWQDVVKRRAANLKIEHPLGKQEEAVFASILAGTQPNTYNRTQVAERLCQLGWLQKHGEVFADAQSTTNEGDSQSLIWLPKTLVMGTSAGEISPLTRIRRYGDVMVLRLLVDLYRDQNLRDDSGISRRVLREKYERTLVGEQGIHRIWGFKPVTLEISWGETTKPHEAPGPNRGRDLWPRLQILQQEGLVEFKPHLCESADSDSEIIHPYGLDWSQNGLHDLSNQVGFAAHTAAGRLALDPKRGVALEEGYRFLAPVARSYPNVQMVGVALLRYRPHTRRTSAWWAEMQNVLPQHIKQYQGLGMQLERTSAMAACG